MAEEGDGEEEEEESDKAAISGVWQQRETNLKLLDEMEID